MKWTSAASYGRCESPGACTSGRRTWPSSYVTWAVGGTYQVVRVIPTGYLSQHVVPSYDLKTLITNSSYADELVEIDPSTGLKTRIVSMPRPYNLYYTPDGRTAIVMVRKMASSSG